MINYTFSRNQLQRIVFTIYFILLIYKFYSGELLFQHSNPPLNYPILNIPYWIFLLSGLKNLIFSNPILKFTITLILFLSCLFAIINKSGTTNPKIFCGFLFLYQFLYFSIVAYQPFTIGILFPCIPFIFKEGFKFESAFNFGRYFLCGLYFLAGILKIVNGGVFNIYQMRDAITSSCLDYMYYHPISFKTELMSFFIENYKIGYLLFVSASILEISFFVAFLTKKFDYLLMMLFLIFHFSNFLILDLPFTNHFIILIFLLPIKNFQNIKNISFS